MRSKDKKVGLDPIEYGKGTIEEFKKRFKDLIPPKELVTLHAECVKLYNEANPKPKKKPVIKENGSNTDIGSSK